MILLLIILPLVMSCPAPPTTTTTTTTRRPGMLTIPERSTYEVASYDGNSMYPDCPKFFSDCRIVQLNDAALQLMTKNWNADFSFRVSSKWMHLDINKTHELDKNFLTYFSDTTAFNVYGDATCMYSHNPNGIRCTFLWNDFKHKFHKSVLYQPATGVTVMANVPTHGYPSYHPHRRRSSKTKPGNRFSTFLTTEEPLPNATPGSESSEENDLLTNYGYSKADDALSWFYRNVLPLDEANLQNLNFGRHDDTEMAIISVTIKYTTEFASTLGIRIDKGLYFVGLWTIETLNRIFGNSKTLIRFKLRCMTLMNIEDKPNNKLEMVEETKKVNKIITGMEESQDAPSQKYFNSNHEARYSNDIVIAYVHELSGYAGKALPYLMHLGASGVVIRFDGLFDPYLLAHEVGHVLGAGHRQEGSDPLYNNRGSMFYAKGFKSSPTGYCTAMTDSQMCKSVPYYSSPKFKLRGINLKIFNKPPKAFEVLGDELHDNARWIKENRFILFSIGNETMECPKFNGYKINPHTILCLLHGKKDRKGVLCSEETHYAIPPEY